MNAQQRSLEIMSLITRNSRHPARQKLSRESSQAYQEFHKAMDALDEAKKRLNAADAALVAYDRANTSEEKPMSPARTEKTVKPCNCCQERPVHRDGEYCRSCLLAKGGE